MTRTNLRTVIGTALAFCVAAALGGCNVYRVQGRVIEGPIGRVVLASESDERMESPGLAGITVKARQGSTRGGTTVLLDETVTDEDGTFSLSMPNNKIRAGRMVVEATGDSIFRVETLVDLPGGGQVWLVQATSRGGGGG